MKKYFSCVTLAALFSFGLVFAAPHDYDITFRTFDQDGSIAIVATANPAADNAIVTAVIAPDGKILIGGDFTTYKGTAVNRLARIEQDGSLDPLFNPLTGSLTTANLGANSTINTIVIAPGGTAENYSIIIGGAFTRYNNIAQNRIARINCLTTDGVQECKLDELFNPIVTPVTAATVGFNTGFVKTLAIAPGGTATNYQILVGGSFTGYYDTDPAAPTKNKLFTQNRLARLNSDGSLDQTFVGATATDGANNIVNTIAIAPGGTAASYRIIIGGSFTGYYDTDPAAPTKNKLFTQNRLARLNADGSLDKTFVGTTGTDGANGIVNTIAIAPGGTADTYSMIIGGTFTGYYDTDPAAPTKNKLFTQNRLARLNADGSLDKTFVGTTAANGANNAVEAIVIYANGKVVIGGNFTTYNGTIRNHIAQLNADGTIDTTFNTPSSYGAAAVVRNLLLQSDGKIIVTGQFVTYDGLGAGRIIRLMGSVPLPSTAAVSSPLDCPLGTAATMRNNQAYCGYEVVAGVSGQAAFCNTDDTLIDKRKITTNAEGVSAAPNGCTPDASGCNLYCKKAAITVPACPAGQYFSLNQNACVPEGSLCAAGSYPNPSSITPPSYPNFPVSPALGTWSTISPATGPLPAGSAADMSVVRYHFGATVYDGKIYVFGGATTHTAEVYDPVANRWSPISSYPLPHAVSVGNPNTGTTLMAVTIGDRIYTFLGKETYEYNPETDAWTRKSDIPGAGKSSGSAKVVDGKAYLVGSYPDKKTYIYSPATDTWSQGADIPKDFKYTEAAVIGGKIYAIGGLLNKTIYVYDTCTNTWERKNDISPFTMRNGSVTQSFTGAWGYNAAIGVDGKIYVAGGLWSNGNGALLYGFFREYNPATQTWNNGLPSMVGTWFPSPAPAYVVDHPRAVYLNGKIYVMGGTSSTTARDYTPSKKMMVYTLSTTPSTKDESVSACNCFLPQCEEGKYFCATEKTCKPANEVCGNATCNKNNTCEIGESCDCSDCTNGGADDQDACWLSSGDQMSCSRDTDFTFPDTPASLSTYTDPALFLSETRSATFYYDHLVPAGTAQRTIPGSDFSFGTNLPSIRWYDPNIYMNRRSLVAGSAARLPAGSYYLNHASLGFVTEKFDFLFQKDVQAFGIQMYEPMGDTTASGCGASCVESTFKFQLYRDGVLVDDTITFSPPNNQDAFFGFWSPLPFDEVRIREITGSDDDEFFGRIFYQDRSAGEPAIAGTDICAIGACCPAGSQWDCDTNSCGGGTLTCPAGQVKTPSADSPVCLLKVTPRTTPTAGSDFNLYGYESLTGNCTLASTTTHDTPGKAISPIGWSTGLSVSSSLLHISATTDSVFTLPSQVTPLLTCPSGYAAYCSGNTSSVIKCGCYASGITPPASVVAPDYTCEIQGCGQGQYYCHVEWICKPANQPCGTVTCNNDDHCDINESCDCADCNNKIDHCGLSTTNVQLLCTKDTVITSPTTPPTTPPTGNTPWQQWVVWGNNTWIFMARAPVQPTVVAGQTFYIYNPERVHYAMPIAQFLADPIAGINNAPVIPIGYTRTPRTRMLFNLARLQSKSPTVQTTVINNLDAVIPSEYLCTTDDVNATKCHVNNLGVLIPAFSYTPDGPIYNSATDGGYGVGMAAVPRLGTFTISNDFQRFDTQASFLAANASPVTVSYDALPTNVRLQSYLYTFPGTGVTIRPNDSGYAQPHMISEFTDRLPGKELATTGKEHLEVMFSTAVNAFGFDFDESTTCRPGYCSGVSQVESTFVIRIYDGPKYLQSYTFTPQNNVATFFGTASRQPFDRVSIQETVGGVDDELYGKLYLKRYDPADSLCQAFTPTDTIYTPNARPDWQGWTYKNGLGTAQLDGGKMVWQVADGSGSNNAVLYKKVASTDVTQFLTKGGKYSASIKNVSASKPTSSAAALLASYLELAIWPGRTVNGVVQTKSKRFTLVFGVDTDKTPTVIGLADDGATYTTPTASTYKYRVVGGANQYNLYEMVYDPATDTVDVFVNGVERISDYPGNTVWSWIPAAAGEIITYFGSGSSPGVAKTNYGPIQLTIKNPSCSAPIVPPVTTVQVGACCPLGSAWNSTQNTCVVTGCGEGQYYCAVENICKPANQSCGTVTCNKNGVCDAGESCNCSDCNGQIDHCGLGSTGQQLYCSADVSVPPTTLPTWAQVGACCPAGKEWDWVQNQCVPPCTTTQAPSELLAGVDQAYITCRAHPSNPAGTTSFRYRLTDLANPTTPYISEITPLDTLVLHPIINNIGNYRVECFYGTAAAVDTTGAPSTCVKHISVRDDEATTQGCDDIYSYKGTTLLTTLEDVNPFTARFQCVSRLSGPAATVDPFSIQYSTNPRIFLGYDPDYLLGSLFPALAYRVSASNSYAFGPGNTPVTCAVKVGGGYSTNASCQKTACVGGNCSTPQTFSVIHSDNLTCTTEAASEYKIGCNPDAPQTTREECATWFRTAIAAQSTPNGQPFTINFNFDGTNTPVQCIRYDAGGMPGGLNLYENVACTQTLNNNEQYTIFAADTGGSPIASLQTTAHTVKKDIADPQILPLQLFLNSTMTLAVPDITRWYNAPLTARVYCVDQPGPSDGSTCACAPQMKSEPGLWSQGIPDVNIGPDRMSYTRTISSSATVAGPQVEDTAHNDSPALPPLNIRIDTQPPTVAIVDAPIWASPLKNITITVTDLQSKIWKTISAPAGATNSGGIVYRIGPKDDVATLMFDADCNVVTPDYATITETEALVPVFPTSATATINNFNPTVNVLTYCIQDNAGNVARGVYPNVAQACFSASNMATLPTIDTYKSLTLTRLNSGANTNQKYGYAFSENTSDANCFRGILASNITTLVANQLTARDSATINWVDGPNGPANVKGTSTANTNGYYYYASIPGNNLTINSSPTGTGPKAVVVDGGDIQINANIEYSWTGKSLIIIARKNNSGTGGNIRIAPNVTKIDAILIADGGALINTDPNAPGQRLIINGRLYSYNTRTGSLQVSGGDFVDAATPKLFINNTLSPATLAEARAQDLERFRVVNSDGNSQCTLYVNYRSYTASQLPPLLQRPADYAGGSCGF